LYEEYSPEDDDLDVPQLPDEPIDLYKIDVGMIPDRCFVKRHRGLQSLAEDSAQRIRSVYLNYLERIGQQGHCYDHTSHLVAVVKEHPLIYKTDGIKIDESALTDLEVDYRIHLIEKLDIVRGDGTDFYYLKYVREAEHRINRTLEQLLARPDHEVRR
jgi:exodeoxyribonuclease V alpha subunit